MADKGISDSQESFSDFWNSQLTPEINSLELNSSLAEVSALDIIEQCQGSTSEDGSLNREYSPTISQCTATQVNVPETMVTVPQFSLLQNSSLPRIALYDDAGQHGFEIDFGPTIDSPSKCTPHTYSLILKKWFVKMGEVCPLSVRCSSTPPRGAVIRATAVFKQPKHMDDIVTRCIHHKSQDKSSPTAVSHLIRAEMHPAHEVKYELLGDKRETVTILYECPANGTKYSTLRYKFMCLSSCRPGLTRKPTVVIFTLESASGEVLGRRVVNTKISTCPGRDRVKEETEGQNPSNGKKVIVKAEKRKLETAPEDNDDGDVFWLKVKGRERYENLKKINDSLMLYDQYHSQSS